MTQLDAYESALLLVGLAKSELRDKADLRAQLAQVRLRAVEDVLRGKVDMHEFERKVLGQSSPETRVICTQCGGKKWFGDVPCSACNAIGESTVLNRGADHV